MIDKNILLSDILLLSGMFVRAYHICQKMGLETVSDLCFFLKRGGSFLKVRDCGTKTSDELHSLAEKYNCRGSIT